MVVSSVSVLLLKFPHNKTARQPTKEPQHVLSPPVMIATTTILSLGLQLPAPSRTIGVHAVTHPVATSCSVDALAVMTSPALTLPELPLRAAEVQMDAGTALFYAEEWPEDATLSCWIDPEDSSKFICARDVDLWDATSSADDSY